MTVIIKYLRRGIINSYEKDDEHNYHHPPQRTRGRAPGSSQSYGRKQLPTIPTQKQLQSRNHGGGRGGGNWDDYRGEEPDPLSYNSRPQSNYKS